MSSKMKPLLGNIYSAEDRKKKLAEMQELAEKFYYVAARIGVHAFIEFCGLMNEYIKICREADEAGQDFTQCNVHTGVGLPFKEHHANYLREKLECIYGPGLLTKHGCLLCGRPFKKGSDEPPATQKNPAVP